MNAPEDLQFKECRQDAMLMVGFVLNNMCTGAMEGLLGYLTGNREGLAGADSGG